MNKYLVRLDIPKKKYANNYQLYINETKKILKDLNINQKIIGLKRNKKNISILFDYDEPNLKYFIYNNYKIYYYNILH